MTELQGDFVVFLLAFIASIQVCIFFLLGSRLKRRP